MKTPHINRLSGRCLMVCAAVSCVLIQLMFCGLTCVMVALSAAFIPDWVYDSASYEALRFIGERLEETGEWVAILAFFCVLSLLVHLGFILYVALRRSNAEAASDQALGAGEVAESGE